MTAGHDPGQDLHPPAVGEGAHFLLAAGELHQGNHGKGQLQAEHDLAEDHEVHDLLVAPKWMNATAGAIAKVRVIIRRSQGRIRKRTNPSIVICPARVPVIVELWPEQIKRQGEGDRRDAGAEDVVEQSMGILDLGDRLAAAPEEGCRGHDEDRRVHQERQVHGDRRIDEVVLACLGHGLAAAGHVAALHQRRVHVEVVRHDRGPDDADGHQQFLAGEP